MARTIVLRLEAAERSSQSSLAVGAMLSQARAGPNLILSFSGNETRNTKLDHTSIFKVPSALNRPHWLSALCPTRHARQSGATGLLAKKLNTRN